MIGFVALAALALLAIIGAAWLHARAAPSLVAPAPPEPVVVELPEPEPLPKPADIDPEVELADLLARANTMAGGKYLAINVGKSRGERRADAAREDRETKQRRKAERRKLERERTGR